MDAMIVYHFIVMATIHFVYIHTITFCGSVPTHDRKKDFTKTDRSESCLKGFES